MLKLFIADLKLVFRNRQYAFWAVMFPLLFTFMFGFFFGDKSTSGGNLILINNSDSQVATTLVKAIEDSKQFNINRDITDPEKAKEQVEKNKAAASLVIPKDFGAMLPNAPREIEVIYDPGNSTVNAILFGFLDQFINQATFQAAGVKEPLYSIKEVKTNPNELNYFDFILAGILGLALMNSNIISIAVGMSKYREDKILKRITTTPMKTWWFIVGEIASRLVMNFIQVSMILVIGKYLFHAHIYGNIFVVYLLALLGAVLFQLLGFVIASFVKTTDAAQGAATAITIPMMFLGGVFFPIDTLPKWLFSIVQYLPIAPLLRIIRAAVLEGESPLANPTNLIIVFVWIFATLIIASWKFRLTED